MLCGNMIQQQLMQIVNSIYKKRTYLLYFLFLIYNLHASNSLFSKQDELINLALDKELHKSHVWKNLLHIQNNNKYSSINNKSYILSFGKFSKKQELITTIKYLSA